MEKYGQKIFKALPALMPDILLRIIQMNLKIMERESTQGGTESIKIRSNARIYCLLEPDIFTLNGGYSEKS
ncbi:MAG: hypothetical protein QG610_2055 [Euryarchaeota archaeon]|nr:hypothetical protein [Euryarchaeota archaeon]